MTLDEGTRLRHEKSEIYAALQLKHTLVMTKSTKPAGIITISPNRVGDGK